jgi:hypothetical protein
MLKVRNEPELRQAQHDTSFFCRHFWIARCRAFDGVEKLTTLIFDCSQSQSALGHQLHRPFAMRLVAALEAPA